MPEPPKLSIDTTLQIVFKQDSFRPVQREVIEAAMDGKDVYLQAATGFGKSLTYQLPAVVVPSGITIVVTPLISLMENQYHIIASRGVNAAALNGTTSATERSRILADLATGHPTCRLLYVSPEFCEQASFRDMVAKIARNGELNRVVVDEAHCISEWGNEFRPAFKELSWFRRTFPKVPITAVTATATLQIREDIVNVLGLTDPGRTAYFLTDVSRDNLHYEVRYVNDTAKLLDDTTSWLEAMYDRRAARPDLFPGRRDGITGIIYCQKRSTCDEVAAELAARGIGARYIAFNTETLEYAPLTDRPYHAGLSAEERSKTTEAWLAHTPGYDIIVATTAFGMGIDNPDVRFVLHYSMPKSFENFYQESGRAGRDGKAGLSIMYYSRAERERGQFLVNLEAGRQQGEEFEAQNRARRESFQKLVEYAESTAMCRHKVIAEYFGGKGSPSACWYACDVCKEGRRAVERRKQRALAAATCRNSQQEASSYFEQYLDE